MINSRLQTMSYVVYQFQNYGIDYILVARYKRGQKPEFVFTKMAATDSKGKFKWVEIKEDEYFKALSRHKAIESAIYGVSSYVDTDHLLAEELNA